MVTWLLTFFATAFLDFVWTQYIAAIAAKRRFQASLWSTGTIGLGGFAAISYVNDPWLLVPAIIGAFVGTWFSIKSGPKVGT